MRLLTVDQVAERLGEKPTWIYDRVRSGELPAVHVGRYVRFRVEVVEAWCDQRPATSGGYGATRAVVAAAKVGKPCADCERSDLPPERMHFHHLDPTTKLYPVSRASSVAAAWREIAKCVLVCPRCHRNRHREMRVSRDMSPDAENGLH